MTPTGTAIDTTTEPPTLTGALSLDVVRGQPILTLSVTCPHCRAAHAHSWGFDPLGPPDTFPATATHRQPHCWRPGSPYQRPRGSGYYVVPSDTPANQRVLDRFVRLTSGAATSQTAAAPAKPATA